MPFCNITLIMPQKWMFTLSLPKLFRNAYSKRV